MKKFTEMTREVDKSGYTPLLLACRQYSNWTVILVPVFHISSVVVAKIICRIG